MAEYLPFAGKNAIVEMAVGIQFQSQFDSKIGPGVEAVKNDFAKDFPKFEALQQFTLNVGAPFPFPTAPSAPGLAGFILTRTKPDTSPSRILRAMGNTVSIHFMEYDSWRQTKSVAINYFDRCLRLLGVMQENPVVAVFMRYIDRFTFDGDVQVASAKLLFRENSKFLPSVIFSGGNPWHSNSGWYEVLFDELKALNNLNTLSLMEPAPTITVDHTIIYSLPKPCNSSAELFEEAKNKNSVIAILDKQHLANTVILKDLLNQKMLDTIGLK